MPVAFHRLWLWVCLFYFIFSFCKFLFLVLLLEMQILLNYLHKVSSMSLKILFTSYCTSFSRWIVWLVRARWHHKESQPRMIQVILNQNKEEEAKIMSERAAIEAKITKGSSRSHVRLLLRVTLLPAYARALRCAHWAFLSMELEWWAKGFLLPRLTLIVMVIVI